MCPNREGWAAVDRPKFLLDAAYTDNMAPNGVNGVIHDDEDIDYTDIEEKCVANTPTILVRLNISADTRSSWMKDLTTSSSLMAFQ